MYMNGGNKTKINLRNKSVFITGVAGFIGSNLAKRLLSTVEGVKVVGLDNMNHYYDVRLKEARLNELEQFENFSFVKGNLADKPVIEAIFEQYKPEIVVNLGAQAGVRYSITNPDAYVEANLIGFYNILEACRHSYDEGHTPVEHLVYASSSSVYGSNKKVPYSTDDKVDNPVSLYLLCLGVSSPKLFAEWIDYLSKKYRSAVINVQFRNKHYGYSVPNVRVSLEDGKEFDQRYDSRVHANLFFQHLNVRPSCYVCEYRERPRISDFTVGDFNNIGSVNSNFDDDFGTTKLWVHTPKGKDILEHIQCNCKWYLIEANGTNIVGGQKKMYKMPENRESFFRDAQNMEYQLHSGERSVPFWTELH